MELSSSSSVRVEQLQQWGGDALHHPPLLLGEILRPGAGPCLAMHLTPPLLLVGHPLPRVLLDRPLQPGSVYGYPELGVDPPHFVQGACPEILVADEDLRTSMSIVSLLRAAHALQVHVRPALDEDVRFPVGQRVPPSRVPPQLVGQPAAAAGRVEDGGDYVPGI